MECRLEVFTGNANPILPGNLKTLRIPLGESGSYA